MTNENAVDALAAWAGFVILPGLIRAIPQIYSGTTVVAFLRKAAESTSPGKFIIKHARELLSRKHELEKSREEKRTQPTVTDFVKRAESLVGEGRLSTAAEILRQASILMEIGARPPAPLSLDEIKDKVAELNRQAGPGDILPDK